ncbi:sensor histidine kinase RcsC [bacterium BMS3Abin08]|nr:sensor histidine kinase RcsC [bacterium BMS3Abin08]
MRLRVVVVDDDELIRSLTSSALESRGYEVIACSEPLFCPVYLDRKCPCPQNQLCCDVIITDINMPNMTGLEFIENQRKNGCKVPYMAIMSGSWTDAELEQAKSLGCHVFRKPLSIDVFDEWLDECEKSIDPNRKLSDFPYKNQQD